MPRGRRLRELAPLSLILHLTSPSLPPRPPLLSPLQPRPPPRATWPSWPPPPSCWRPPPPTPRSCSPSPPPRRCSRARRPRRASARRRPRRPPKRARARASAALSRPPSARPSACWPCPVRERDRRRKGEGKKGSGRREWARAGLFPPCHPPGRAPIHLPSLSPVPSSLSLSFFFSGAVLGIAGAAALASSVDSSFSDFIDKATLRDCNNYAGYEPALKGEGGVSPPAGGRAAPAKKGLFKKK